VDGLVLVEVWYLNSLSFELAPGNSWTAALQHLLFWKQTLVYCSAAVLVLSEQDTG
jgi:hypothetical protein